MRPPGFSLCLVQLLLLLASSSIIIVPAFALSGDPSLSTSNNQNQTWTGTYSINGSDNDCAFPCCCPTGDIYLTQNTSFQNAVNIFYELTGSCAAPSINVTILIRDWDNNSIEFSPFPNSTSSIILTRSGRDLNVTNTTSSCAPTSAVCEKGACRFTPSGHEKWTRWELIGVALGLSVVFFAVLFCFIWLLCVCVFNRHNYATIPDSDI